MNNTAKAYMAITLQALVTGFSFLALKIALRSAGTFDLLAHRFTLAALSVLVFSFFRRDSVSIRLADFIKILPYGIAYPVVFFFFQTLGMTQVSSSEAGIIYAVVPILTLIIAGILLKEKIRGIQAVFMILSIAGVIFINLMNGFHLSNYSFTGFLLILISAAALALYNVLVRKLATGYDPFTIACALNIMGFFFFNIVAVARHGTAGTLSVFFSPFTDATFVITILFLGVFCSLITSLLTAYALKTLPAVHVGLFNNVGTIVSVLAGTIFLDEAFFWYHFVGIVAILAGTVSFNLISGKK